MHPEEPLVEQTRTKNASAPTAKMADLDRRMATGSRLPTLPKEDDSVSTAEHNEPAVNIDEACDWCLLQRARQTGTLDPNVQQKRPLEDMSCKLCDMHQETRTAMLDWDVNVLEPRRLKGYEDHEEQLERVRQKVDSSIEEVRKAAHKEIDIIHEQKRQTAHQVINLMFEQKCKAMHQEINLGMKEINEVKVMSMFNEDRHWITVRQYKRRILVVRGLEELSQQKADIDRRIHILLRQRSHDAAVASSAGELQQESSSQPAAHMNQDSDRAVDDAALPRQETADTEQTCLLRRLAQREEDIIRRLDETAKHHQEIEESEHARRLDELSQREALLIQGHKQRMLEASQHELDSLDAEEAKAVAVLAPLAARRAQLAAESATA
jgi:hypothetical protein